MENSEKVETKNSKKPIIGIIGRPNTTLRFEYACMSVLSGYRRAVIKSKGIPIGILPTQNICYEEVSVKDAPALTEAEKDDIIAQINLCDGLIFPGGNRIYDYDLFIAEYALEHDIPVLGTCMGMQILARVEFTKDEQNDVLKLIETGIEHRQSDKKYVHYVDIEKDSKLYSIIGEEKIKVNSRHKYCVNKLKTAKVSAISEDGIIEGIEFPNKKFAIGVQWHPEDMVLYDEPMEKLMTAFINACKM
jgi:putative glutamine amidotransferase